MGVNGNGVGRLNGATAADKGAERRPRRLVLLAGEAERAGESRCSPNFRGPT